MYQTDPKRNIDDLSVSPYLLPHPRLGFARGERVKVWPIPLSVCGVLSYCVEESGEAQIAHTLQTRKRS
jgi:hypothetical protein